MENISSDQYVAMPEALLFKHLSDSGVDLSEEVFKQILVKSKSDPDSLNGMILRLLGGEPAGLLLGETTFLGLALEVAPGALVPRTETELLARTALDILDQHKIPRALIIDMCCGVGNIAVALAYYAPDTLVWASDLTSPPVLTARRNAELHGVQDRVEVVQGDLFQSLRGRGLEGTIDLIVCNPPYISTKRLEGDRAHLLAHEPREAFDAGPYGLLIHQRVIAEAPEFLKPGGWLLFEFGVGQGRQVRFLFERSKKFNQISLVNDITGLERVAVGRL